MSINYPGQLKIIGIIYQKINKYNCKTSIIFTNYYTLFKKKN